MESTYNFSSLRRLPKLQELAITNIPLYCFNWSTIYVHQSRTFMEYITIHILALPFAAHSNITWCIQLIKTWRWHNTILLLVHLPHPRYLFLTFKWNSRQQTLWTGINSQESRLISFFRSSCKAMGDTIWSWQLDAWWSTHDLIMGLSPRSTRYRWRTTDKPHTKSNEQQTKCR